VLTLADPHPFDWFGLWQLASNWGTREFSFYWIPTIQRHLDSWSDKLQFVVGFPDSEHSD